MQTVALLQARQLGSVQFTQLLLGISQYFPVWHTGWHDGEINEYPGMHCVQLLEPVQVKQSVMQSVQVSVERV